MSGSETANEFLLSNSGKVLRLDRGEFKDCLSNNGNLEADNIRGLLGLASMSSFLNLGVNSSTKLDCRCKMCSRFLKNNLSSYFLSFWSCRVSLLSVAASMAFRTRRCFALLFDKTSSSLLDFMLLRSVLSTECYRKMLRSLYITRSY